MTRVLISTGIFPPDIGGPATYVPKYANFLVERGLDTKVITRSQLLSDEVKTRPYEVIRIRLTSSRTMNFWLSVYTLLNNMRDTNQVFSNGMYIETALAMKICRFKGRSLVKIVGDPVWERERNRLSTRETKGKIFHYLWRSIGYIERKLLVWSLLQFNEVVSPGYEFSKTVESWSSKLNVRVVENGVGIPPENGTTRRIDLVTVSRLVPWKNIDCVIKVARDLDYSLIVVGDGPSRPELEELASTASNVRFLGKLTSEEIEELLRECKVFVQYSDYEGLSFSLLQAMANSVPCVLSDIPANRDVFSDNPDAALFVPLGDFESLRGSIKSLIESEAMRRDFGESSRTIVFERFDEKVKMKEMLDLLNNHD